MKNLFEQKQVEELADKVLVKLRDKIKEDIAESFYSEISCYLYEHYTNSEDKIKKELIEQVTEEFVKNPLDYKFKTLRKKIFEENKEELTKILTDEQIFENVEKIIWEYTHKKFSFAWKWEETIAKVIIKNINSVKDNETIKNCFARENEALKMKIERLEERVKKINEIIVN